MKTIEITLDDPKELIERNIIIKNKKYVCSNTVVLAIETTCNYSKDYFKGIVVENLNEYSPRHPDAIGNLGKWHSTNFKEYNP